MSNEINLQITYQGNQISFISDERNDYINLTDLANAWNRRKSIISWLQNKQTLDFLNVWEKKNNPQYRGTEFGTALNLAKDKNTSLSIKIWIELTNAKGIFTRKFFKALVLFNHT